jgi:hypothetical protein
MYADKAGAATFKLRTSGARKAEELTETARANLLIELAGCSSSKEEAAVCQHYRVRVTSARKIQSTWRERGTLKSKARTKRDVKEAQGEVESDDSSSESEEDE